MTRITYLVSDTLPEGFQPAPDGVESMQPGLWDGDIGQDEFLSLKADGFKTRDYVLKNPDTEKRVEEWIESFPAMTATRVLHVCDSDTLGWAYQRVHGKGTKGKLSDLCWQRVPPGNSGVEEETMRRLVLEVKPPCEQALQSLLFSSVKPYGLKGSWIWSRLKHLLTRLRWVSLILPLNPS